MSVFNKDKMSYINGDDPKSYYYSRELGQSDAYQIQNGGYALGGYGGGPGSIQMQQQRQVMNSQPMQSLSRSQNDSSMLNGVNVKPIPIGGYNAQQAGMNLSNMNSMYSHSNHVHSQSNHSHRQVSSFNSFDTSNFPLLTTNSLNSGGINHMNALSKGTAGPNSNSSQFGGFNAPYGNSNLSQMQQQQRIGGGDSDDFTLENEDFPALPTVSGSSQSKNSNELSSLSNQHHSASSNAFVARDPSLVNSLHIGGSTSTGSSLHQEHSNHLHYGSGGLGTSSSSYATASHPHSDSSNHHISSSGSSSSNSVNQLKSGSLGGNLLGGGNTSVNSLLASLNSSSIHINSSSSSSSSSTGSHPMSNSKEFRYGLSGLLDIIRIADKNLNTLSLGTDLTAFGLNLNAADSLFPTFSSPFTEHVLTPDPQFRTPQCYMMHPPSLKAEHLSKFQIETLFYMFYAMPRDILQVYSAQELYRRDWRFHGELRTWLKPRAPIELMQSHPSVQFLYFDCNTWEARLFTAASSRDNVAIGLLTEDEIRVPNVTAAL